jgi:hypothetical protein
MHWITVTAGCQTVGSHTVDRITSHVPAMRSERECFYSSWCGSGSCPHEKRYGVDALENPSEGFTEMASPAAGRQHTFSHIDPYQCGKCEGEHRAVVFLGGSTSVAYTS